MAGDDREALERDPAPALGRHRDPQRHLRAGRDVDGPGRVPIVRELDLVARRGRIVAHCDPKLGALAREHGMRADQLDLGAEQVAVAMVHQHEREAGEQEREHEAQARAVVQRAEQHREHHRCEHDAEARREDVDPAPF